MPRQLRGGGLGWVTNGTAEAFGSRLSLRFVFLGLLASQIGTDASKYSQSTSGKMGKHLAQKGAGMFDIPARFTSV